MQAAPENKKSLTVVSDGDGYFGLYENGGLIAQGPTSRLLDAVAEHYGIELVGLCTTAAYNDKVLFITGEFPDRLEEVEIEK